MQLEHKKPYHHGDLYRACIEQGLQFLAQGQTNFSMRDLARSLGVSHGAPGKHFQNKEGLLAAIAEEGFRILNAYLEESFVPGNLRESFLQMGRSYLLFGLENPAHYRIMLGDKIRSHANYASLNQESKKSLGQLVYLVQQLQAAEVFIAGNAFEFAYCIWAGVHGLVNLAIEDHIKLPQPIKPASTNYKKHLQEHCLRLADQMNQSFFLGFSHQ
ncbi:MAG: TetR/AcrR family transcriptional regulator [Spirochaetota bacterium]